MTSWHAPADVLVRFTRSPESLDDVTASSVEQHLVTCAECRSVVAEAADIVALRQSWAGVADVIDRPRTTFAERTLDRSGVPAGMARVVTATRGLRVAWLATTVALAAAAIATARDSGSDAPFLVLAPLVPLGSVLLAFLPTEEPAGEAAGATPMYGAGLLLWRALAVLVPTFVILGLAGLAQPHLTAGGALWILPGLTLVLGSLALATVVRVALAAATLATSWLALLISVSALDGRSIPVARTAVFGLVGQVTALALALVFAAGLFLRRDHLSTMETGS